MQRPNSHQIDEAAQRIFVEALPTRWVHNVQSADYGKDYLVELSDSDGKMTGESFYVQLKGKQNVSVAKGGTMAKFVIESHHARYWTTITDLPVFLVVVDTTRKEGWWIFLQRLLEEDQRWKKKGSTTIKLPLSSHLGDIPKLTHAIHDAKLWLRANHPGSIQDAILAQKKKMIRSDPRFDVNLAIIEDEPTFQITANEPVDLSVTFFDPKKCNQVFDTGGVVEFLPGELKITGSNHFEAIENTGCKLQLTTTVAASVMLTVIDADTGFALRLPEFAGEFVGGRKTLAFSAQLPHSPFKISFELMEQATTSAFHIDFAVESWDGQHLLQLAYFEPLHSFIRALQGTGTISIECVSAGELLFAGGLKPPINFQKSKVFDFLEVVVKARKLSERFSVNPIWRLRNLNVELIQTIVGLYDACFGTGWRRNLPNVTLKLDLQRDGFRAKALSAANGNFRFVVARQFVFFGKAVDVGLMIHDYTEMIARRLRSAHKDVVSIALTATTNTISVLRSADDAK